MLVAAMLLWVGGARAAKAGGEAEKQPDAVKATLEGTNFCVGCALKSKEGAGAQCEVFGHLHTFRVSRAMGADGKVIPEMQGWVLHYLETQKSAELIRKHHGEKLKIEGTVYPVERVLEVSAFQGIGAKEN